MKSLLLAMSIGLMMVGCGEEAKKEAVQEEAKELAPIRAERERERREEEWRLAEEELRLAVIRAEEERKQ